jgi:hypothetical protein
LIILLSLVSFSIVRSYDPTRPQHVEQGWAFYANGAVAPEETYEVKQARLYLESVRNQQAHPTIPSVWIKAVEHLLMPNDNCNKFLIDWRIQTPRGPGQNVSF